MGKAQPCEGVVTQALTLVSVSSSWPHGLPEDVTGHQRRSTWGLGPLRTRLRLLGQMAALARAGWPCDTWVVVTCGWELLMLCALKGRRRLVVADWLVPTDRLFARSWLWRRVDEFVVIRSGDADHLAERFGVDRTKARFVRFPAPSPEQITAPPAGVRAPDVPYVYSAGWAHRDWATLSDALELAAVPAVVSCDSGVRFPCNVTVMPPLSPEDGRVFLKSARCLVLALKDTHLPSGPLVLLDAMSREITVIATNVNGVRDYVEDGVTGVLVPPEDPEALARAIDRVMSDRDYAADLARRGRQWASQLTADSFWQGVLHTASSDLTDHRRLDEVSP